VEWSKTSWSSIAGTPCLPIWWDVTVATFLMALTAFFYVWPVRNCGGWFSAMVTNPHKCSMKMTTWYSLNSQPCPRNGQAYGFLVVYRDGELCETRFLFCSHHKWIAGSLHLYHPIFVHGGSLFVIRTCGMKILYVGAVQGLRLVVYSVYFSVHICTP